MQLDLLNPRRKVKLPPALERQTHIALADLLRKGALTPGWWWTHIGHGELRTAKTAALLKRMGLRPGISDFMFIDPVGQVYFLELKRKGGVILDSQHEFQVDMTKRRVPWAVVWTYQDAIDQLCRWGAVRLAA